MKKFVTEDTSFTLTVIGGKTNAQGALDCRNGHEIGDRYVCEYGCPDGFCQKCMLKAFPLMEAVRSGGDLRQLGGEGRNAITFCCPDGAVLFRLDATRKGSLN